MKSLQIATFLFLTVCGACTVEQKAAPAPTSTLGARVVTEGEVVDAVIVAICDRGIECTPGTTMTVSKCFDAASTSAAKTVDRERLVCTRGELDACTDALQVAECSQIGAKGWKPDACATCVRD